jgi:hypothetical protein
VAAPAAHGFGDPFPAPLGERLPSSTEQIMHPDAKFLVQRDEPTELRLLPAAKSIREDALGELETSLLLAEHLGAAAATSAQGWDGDRYRLVQTAEGPVFEWFSVWDDAASADRFADAYRQIALRRGRAARVERLTVSDRPVVSVVDAPNARALNQALLSLPRLPVRARTPATVISRNGRKFHARSHGRNGRNVWSLRFRRHPEH